MNNDDEEDLRMAIATNDFDYVFGLVGSLDSKLKHMSGLFDSEFNRCKVLKEQLLNSEKINNSLHCCGNCRYSEDFSEGVYCKIKDYDITASDLCISWSPDQIIVDKLRRLQGE